MFRHQTASPNLFGVNPQTGALVLVRQLQASDLTSRTHRVELVAQDGPPQRSSPAVNQNQNQNENVTTAASTGSGSNSGSVGAGVTHSRSSTLYVTWLVEGMRASTHAHEESDEAPPADRASLVLIALFCVLTLLTVVCLTVVCSRLLYLHNLNAPRRKREPEQSPILTSCY